MAIDLAVTHQATRGDMAIQTIFLFGSLGKGEGEGREGKISLPPLT